MPPAHLVSSVDARLFALDAHTGALCQDFGDKGYVDLKKGMGPTENSKRYHPTSLPVVMGHLTVVGGWVRDIVAGEPSGAVRAFDVLTGKLVWAWDVGAPESADAATGAAVRPGNAERVDRADLRQGPEPAVPADR
jgi:quinate dehydrogenase (quinone)